MSKYLTLNDHNEYSRFPKDFIDVCTSRKTGINPFLYFIRK